MNDDDFPLWSFTLGVYQTPGIEPLCLKLQDRAQANVPLVLFYLWLDYRALTLSKDDGQQARQQAQHWQRHVITPLRSARRWMKASMELDAPERSLREDIQAAELLAEKQLLWRLQQLSKHAGASEEPPHYLAQYLSERPMSTAERRQALVQLLQATPA